MSAHQPFPGQPPHYGPIPLRPDEERTWAIVAHIGGLVLGFVAPLVVWQVFKGRGPYLENQAKEALNFQITLAIAYAVAILLAILTLGLASPLALGVSLAGLIFMILAAVAAGRYEWYRYPATLRLVS
ncbi:DUF4870 domain-containing protein [Cellulomonas chengniuliangii]|uniref:DUF4870 domain-containing protein n=1 Tax=Cellulomonas chengniuliangii TaxID=2968084 RepID=A0ABY5L234_9CELL|nr:DUF4870 domain-containing protein [Cellulomonas chengniuliangii]MCC2308022.1 DUF4870 domain-containing protein [Cellulomonas chengniuliangii]MCC2318244.1 DUF4870 domain-containing protein [Cellulomonas chengniuliangii]UUI76424.1 DUF4870 domain-containing protein [Cellulomonas chengniuliangii]